jgi:hypothetical protein
MTVLDRAGGVVPDCEGARWACIKVGVQMDRRPWKWAAITTDAVRMGMVIPFQVEKITNF